MQVTVADAAAPDASVIAIYTIGAYWVFRGKLRHA